MVNSRNFPQLIWNQERLHLLQSALAEDLGAGDVTTERTVPEKLAGRGQIIAKAAGILCGAPVAHKIWQLADKKIVINWLAHDGAELAPGQVVAEMEGRMRGLLIGERVALNFLQQLSGVASLTAKFHAAAGGPGGPVICDTRKTTPLWRYFERYAVAIGGGCNHRFGLFDMVLIKENHARAAGGLREAIQRSRVGTKKFRIAAEARDLAEVKICCEERVDLILLDNFTPARAKKAIEQYRPAGIPFEISGGVSLQNIASYAKAAPDRISIGALTHSAPALDLSVQLYQAEA